MLLSETVAIRWNGLTKKHYEERGYICIKMNELFDVKIEDLHLKSTAKVTVKCDYCGAVHEKRYCNYNRNKEYVNKDCCTKCRNKKQGEVIKAKYSVDNINQLPSRRKASSELMRTSTEDILLLCNKKGLQVLNISDYENDRTRLQVICNNHVDKGIQDTNFANIKSNKHCCKYIKNRPSSRRLDGNLVYDMFVKNGLIPQFKPTDYKSNSQPLPYICPKHQEEGVQHKPYSSVQMGTIGCEQCRREKISNHAKNDQEKVFADMVELGLIPIDGQTYTNKETPIYYKCVLHQNNIQHLYYGSINRVKQHCNLCRIENSLSSLNRRLRSSIGAWREKAITECGGKCVITGSNVFDVHHTYSFNSIIKDSLKLLKISIKESYTAEEILQIKSKVIELHHLHRGVCIHPDLHTLFHQIYGKQNNTVEQFEEFKHNYFADKEVVSIV